MEASEAQQTSEETLTPHEQEMINLVDSKETVALGQADPEKAPEYQEEAQDTPDEIDYKAEYEKLKALQDDIKDGEGDNTQSKQPDGLEIEDTTKVENEPEEQTASQLTPEQMDKYTSEYSTNGGLSEDSYKELEKIGISKEVVDTYIQGQSALKEAQVTKVYNAVGGADTYSEMIEWAKSNWTPEQINVFNSQVNSSDEAQIMFGVDALATQYKAAKGSPIPKRTLSGSAKGTSGNSRGFESKADMYKAMNNSLYGKDASYTNMVAQKIANSSF